IMNFQVKCELAYNLQGPATFLFALKCIRTGGQSVLTESLVIEPLATSEDFSIEGGMNRFTRIMTWNPGILKITYQALVSTSTWIISKSSLQPEVGLFPSREAVSFLFPSRYCQSDRLREQAHELFGQLGSPYEIASGISDWIFANVSYVIGSSGENSSAIDTLEQRQGVCRDFAHLGITFCRAMSVPARYVTCYAHQLEPPDFHACFEVLINGCWYLFDATRLVPLNGLVRIATGRDAADAAVCTIFGSTELTTSIVSCECDSPNFIHVTRDSLVRENQAIALL
ncbi:MAG: transglutaminase family protein, partial [Luteolibacter sp.]